MKTIKKQLVTTLLASSFMAFAGTATAAAVNIAAGQTHVGDISSNAAVTLGAGAVVCGKITAVTLTLGAGAGVSESATVTTATLGANAYVLGTVAATTLTLGANSCYGGGSGFTTLTVGASAGQCTSAVSTSCVVTPVTTVPTTYPSAHGGTDGHGDGSSHTHNPDNIHSH